MIAAERLPGLNQARQTIERLMHDADSVHAIMLLGPEGSGALPLAKWAAQCWMCLSPIEGSACGECQSCRSMASGKHPDFQLIAPKGPSGLIRVSAIRESGDDKSEDTIPVTQFLRTRPLSARRKVVIIHEAHRMNEQASNSLLKTLEEPHETSKLVLTSSSASRVRPTILSRCLCVSCDLPSEEELSAFPEWIRVLGEGAPEIIQQVQDSEDIYRQIWEVCQRSLRAQPAQALRLSEELRTLGDKLGDKLELGVRWGQSEVLRCLGLVFRQEAASDPERLLYIAETHRRILGNGHGGIQFDALFAKLLA